MIHTLEFRAMGCQMLAAIDDTSPRARRLLEQAPEWFESWEDCLSRFRPHSELNQLNRSQGQAVPVSETLWSVLQAARRAAENSQGLVTPTVLNALVSAGYEHSFESLEGQQTAGKQTAGGSQSGACATFQEIELDERNRTVRLPQDVHIDFGGIAKGWAAHQAMKRLQPYGPSLVDAGGDIAISGLQTNGETWAVGVDDPRDPEATLGTLNLGRCGVATSGKDYRRWQQNSVWKHHLIDPRSGQPSQSDVLSATVIAPTLLEAEMAAKVVLLRGSRDGLHWLAERPALMGLIITDHGELLGSPALLADAIPA